MRIRLFSRLVLLLAVIQLLLVLLSWLLSAMMVEGVRSLLSSEGLRWFLGSFASMLATPWLVWLLLLSMAGGCLWRSGLAAKPHTYRDRTALRAALVLMAVYVAFVLVLTAAPHAILLSATGRLFPSPFSRALVPLVAFGIILVSSVYGRSSGRFSSFSDIVDSLSFGIAKAGPLFVAYVMLIQLYESLRFVCF